MSFLNHFLLFLSLTILVSGAFSCVDDDEMQVETDPPLLRLSQTALQFELSECSSVNDETFAPIDVLVENAGQGELEQISYQISYNGLINDWLDINYNNELFTITPIASAVDDLSVGAYTAVIKVSASNAINNFEEIHVLFEVMVTTGGNIEVVFHVDNASGLGVNVGWAYTLIFSEIPGLTSLISADLASLTNIHDGHVEWLSCLRTGNYDFDFFIDDCNMSTSGSLFDLSSGETRRIDVYIDC